MTMSDPPRARDRRPTRGVGPVKCPCRAVQGGGLPTPPRARARGSAMFMLLTVVGLLYIFGTMFLQYMSQERQQTAKLGEIITARYLAEAGVELAMVRLRDVFSKKLLDSAGEIDDQVLSLLDIDRAENFTLKVEIADGRLMKGGTVDVLVEVTNLKLTPFKTYIDEYEEVPRR
jgi:hypothetical protein